MKKKYIFYILAAIVATVLFVAISQVSQMYSADLQRLTAQAGVLGMVSYVGVMIVSIVVAPIGTGFLLPVAANSWGPVLASVLSIVGWTIGSLIAFFLARKYGLAMVKNVKTITHLRALEQAIPKHNIFIAVVLLRIALPVDLLSYALGIFSTMTYRMFFLSTVLGISPFAFIFMYAATSTVTVQIWVSVFGTFLMIGGLYYVYISQKKNVQHIEEG